MTPPPVTKPTTRAYESATDCFDATFRKWQDGQWADTPLALLSEVFTWLRMHPHPQSELSNLMPYLRRCLRQHLSPSQFQSLVNLTPQDFEKPSGLL